MASNSQTVPKLLRNLRDNGKFVLQCGALTYIRSNAEKLETSSALSKEEYAEICKLVMELSINGDQNTKNEATKALHIIVKHFKKHSLKFFESALFIEREKRLKIFQFLEAVDDSSLMVIINDPPTINFIEDCLSPVQVASMEWLSPNSCTDNLQILKAAETKIVSGIEEVEEIIVHNTLTLLRNIYRTASSCTNKVLEKFDVLVMNKVMTLAYMGHERQRSPAIKLLFQAIDSDLSTRIKTKEPNVYSKYKNDIEGPYCARMMLLVKARETDWAKLWAISVQILGTDLHRGASLINKLLSVEERAFKSTDTMIRRDAFGSWKLLVDNLALDMTELPTKRRVKLLCVPLTLNNSKSELIALKKLEVWWHLISKLYQYILPFAEQVVTPFLNFCFGPLGDTPLLSSKCDIIPSPGKRFYKTQISAIDALLQLLVADQNERILMASELEDKLPSSVNDELFKQCYKAFIHSVGEAVMIIFKFNDNEMKHKEEICTILWSNLIRYVRTMNQEIKNVYNELILLISELQIRSLKKECLNDFLRNAIIPELAGVATNLVYYDDTLVNLMTKIMVPTFLKNLQGKQCEAVKILMWQTVRPETLTNYHPKTLPFLEATLQQLRSIPIDTDSLTDCFELWFTYAEIAFKYMKALQDVNEGTGTETNFKTIESIISFPFTHLYWANSMQAQKIAVHWKDVYKKYECQADTIASIKPNQIFNNTTKMIDECLVKNEKGYRIAVYCLDALMATINYKAMLAQSNIPTIVRLVGDLTTIALHEGQPSEAEWALRALSSLLITVYGHSPQKVLFYLKATSQSVELMLKTDAEDVVVKEITSTWETIVSILRGLSADLDENFLQSYRHIISLSLKHSCPEISSQSVGILDLKENVKENAKSILAELAQEWKKTSIKDPTKSKVDKTDRMPKAARVAGSFLNRKSTSPRTLTRGKEESNKKLAPLPPEPDSQDYVVIQSEIDLDVDRLTEHQKEIFKKRRDHIITIYNNYSQSSSQDTQDLQQWFGGKKNTNEQQQKTSASDATKGDTKAANIDFQTFKGDARSKNFNAETLPVKMKSTAVDAKSLKVDTKSANVEMEVATTETTSSQFNRKSVNVDPKSLNVDTKSSNAEAKVAKIEAKSPQVTVDIIDARSKTTNKTVGPKTVKTFTDVDSKTLKVGIESANPDSKVQEIEVKSTLEGFASIATVTPKVETKSTNVNTKAPKIGTEVAKAGPKCSKIHEKVATANKVENPIVSLEKMVTPVTVTKTVEANREPEEKLSKMKKSPETISSSAQDPKNESILLGAESLEEPQNFEKKKPEEATEVQNSSPASGQSYMKETKSPDCTEPNEQECIAKKLNFDLRDEFPEEENNMENSEIRSLNKTSRNLRSGKVCGINSAEEKPQQETVTKGGSSTRGKSIGESEQKSTGEIEESANTDPRGGFARRSRAAARSVLPPTERGTKRKVCSDLENEDSSGEQEKKRRKSSRSPSGSEDSTPSQLVKRTEIEISRLRIDMINDGPLRTRRRSKYLNDFVDSESLGKRTHSPDVHGRAGRGRGSSNPRKMIKSTELDDAVKRRRGRFTRLQQEDEKTEVRKENESGVQTTKPLRSTRSRQKRNVQESGAASESQLITDDDEIIEEVKSTLDEEFPKESVEDTSVKRDAYEEPAIPEAPIKPTEETSETQMDLDLDEVVESSQSSNISTTLKSFGKIVKSINVEGKPNVEQLPVETLIEKKQPTASSPINPSSTGIINESGENIVEDPDETFLDISAIRPQLADDVPVEEPEKKAPEASKTSASPVSTKPETNLHSVSPKTHGKRFTKSKSFVPQGRTAHMLGLVTKLGVLEKESSAEKNQIDEEVAIMGKIERLRSLARSIGRSKENEGEILFCRKTNVVREPEKMGSPSGSRQEKIFNNMKSADYAASPPGKMFSNLKNNGEKISPKMEKSLAESQENGTAGKEDGINISLASEREELPILEWSSANPPSLTASPSVSILKRNRSIVNEVEPDPPTPVKPPRKRVSFADPPVSKEMGYETEAATSPHKIAKYNASRGLYGRRDSPTRVKQSKYVMISVDTEKFVQSEEPQVPNCEVDVNCARNDQLSMEIAEELEELANVETSEKNESFPSTSVPDVMTVMTPAHEIIEIEQIQKITEEAMETCTTDKNALIEESQTQDDLFNSSDEKNDSPKQPANRRNDVLKESFNVSSVSSLDSFKLNVTEDSVIGAVSDVQAEETTRPVDNNLEDTVDARNVMLSSLEENLNDQFDTMPIHTSSQRPDPISEMDTLPVGDSILSSQPNTMDSQGSTLPVLEITRPDLLNSTEPIYPNLNDCDEPIDSIIDNLTNPLWRKNLSKYLETRCIRTVGDLANLSEREIVRIPVKGTSKVDFVRKVLQRYESKLRDSEAEKRPDQHPESDRFEEKNTVPKAVQLSDELRKTLGDISLDNSKIQPDSMDLDNSVLRAQSTNDFLSIDDLNPLQPLARTSTTNSISTLVIDSSTEPEITVDLGITAELNDTASVSRMKTIDLASDTLPVATASVATSTDPVLTSVTSVGTQIDIEEFVDGIDVDVLLKSVVKRVSAEKLLMEYVLKMEHASETEICEKTIETLGIDNKTLLKLVCRKCGLKKLLHEIPDIFEME
ncbi:telomere-associated protein RIF1 isoform X2 [Venturia canescens]|uniref:telomere-associated protein RIF1 isoform X2 n=1 Tax=Venturia canescens TaxID=32260 RepID=UPI001C9BCE21|nr:telomere-associated protein RIF1-like isoform X2 [Venturia canescens]